MNKDELIEMAVEDFLEKHEAEYKDPKNPKEYTRPFEGEPDFLVTSFSPLDEPKSVTFVLRSGHKHSFTAPESKPKSVARAAGRGRGAGRGRAAAGEEEDEAETGAG